MTNLSLPYQELSGIFEMRIHSGEYSVGQILDDCRVDPRRIPEGTPGIVDGVDIAALSRRLTNLPVGEIRRRRQRFNLFYEEVLVSADPVRGISFTTVLLILAHYNVISDNKSLRFEDSSS
jgi:hypothetical protein